MDSSVLYPVQALQEHLSALEAAITVCLAEPDHKPVHKLRTETRKVEALLLLLAKIPDMPEHRKQSGALLHQLKRLRRAAGEVRDFDVHRKLLEDFAEAQRMRTEPAKVNGRRRATKQAAAAPGVNGGSATLLDAATLEDASVLGKAACELRDELGHAREHAAKQLQGVLAKHQIKVAKDCQSLIKKLKAGDGFAMQGPDLLRDAQALLTRDGVIEQKAITSMGRDELHSVRKAAKKARYLTELLPQDATLAEAARAFETMQEAGGQWHDALQLTRAARCRFGKGHELTGVYRSDRDKKLHAYQDALLAHASTGRAAKPSRRTKAKVETPNSAPDKGSKTAQGK